MKVDWPSARELMTAKPITLSTDAPVSRALGLMREAHIHEVPILRDRRLVGMVTFESIARRTNLPLSTKVEHLMVLPPLVTATTRYPEIAEQLLAVGLRGAPVVGKKGELLGIVSRTDLVRVLPKLAPMSGHNVDDVASPASLVLHEEDPCAPLFNQVRLLEEHPLPVIDRKGRLVGAVGIADLGQVLWRAELPGKRDRKARGGTGQITIGSIMHSPPVTVSRAATTGDAARAMAAAGVSSVFLVEDGRPTGVVSQADLLGLSIGLDAAAAGSPLKDVYVQVHGLRGSGDPETLTELDELIAKSLRRLSHHARPTLLSVQVSPHSARSGDATVHVRLHTDRGIFFATETGWNFFASVTSSLDDILSQVQRAHEASIGRRRRGGRGASEEDEIPADPDLERKMRAARGADDEG